MAHLFLRKRFSGLSENQVRQRKILCGLCKEIERRVSPRVWRAGEREPLACFPGPRRPAPAGPPGPSHSHFPMGRLRNDSNFF